MLKLDALTKSFSDHPAVKGLSLSLQAGDVLGFLGQNGAGKSTTMRMVAGVLEPDSGDATIMGHSILTERAQAQARLGYLPEGAPIYPDMTPLGFLRFLADAHGLSRLSRKENIDRVIAQTRIADITHQTMATLSKGYRRRVALAGALIHNPDVLLLDEPTDGLDPIQKRAVRALIAHMSKDKAIVISTHSLEDVLAMCSRVLIIDRGECVADDTPAGLASRHQGDLEAAFIHLSKPGEAGAPE